MSEDEDKEHKHGKISGFFHNIEASFVITVVGIWILFLTSIVTILIAPRYIDVTWTSPTTPYQVMMYEVVDPNLYISTSRKGLDDLEFVHHLKQGFTLLSFQEDNLNRIIAPTHLEKYITKLGDKKLKLTSKLLFIRKPVAAVKKGFYDAAVDAEKLRSQLQTQWEKDNPKSKESGLQKIDYHIWELYDPEVEEAFSVAMSEGTLENWVDKDFTILEGKDGHPYHGNEGVVYIRNPQEYRVSHYQIGSEKSWKYDPEGAAVKDLALLKSKTLGFLSRKDLIEMGEEIFKIEGCWYCHTDQTRTLVQDVVLNGSETYPAPPSSPNEYIYQKVTFMGTRRIGPDLSRVGVKRPSRDWHKGHFWFPKTESPGSIMPAFRHFFDNDPRGTSRNPYGIPNYRFEALFQYLMTKGTRITPPTQAWWLGKDPVQTLEIIEGRKAERI